MQEDQKARLTFDHFEVLESVNRFWLAESVALRLA